MKGLINLIFIAFVVCSYSPARAEESSLFPKDIPARVRYTRPSEASVKAAYAVLNKMFASDWTKPVGLFKDKVIVDSYLWLDLQKMEPFKSDPGNKVTTIIPGGKTGEGKLFRSAATMDALEKYLRERLLTQGEVTIRPPNYEELNAYWSVIAWDINSPLFVIEAGSQEKYILDFNNGAVFQIVTLTEPGNKK